MANIIVPSRRIWTLPPGGPVQLDRRNPFGERCDLAWLAAADASGHQRIPGHDAQAVNFAAMTAVGKSPAVAARPFTVVLVMAFPVASVANGYGIYVGSGNGFRLDMMTTGGGIYAGWTANGVANGGNTARDGTAKFDMRPVVLVSDWTATGQTSWWRRRGEAMVSWSDSFGYLAPSNTTVYLGQGAAGCERHYGAYLLEGNVGEAGARALLENPWQIFRPRRRMAFFDLGAGGGSSLNGQASGSAQAAGSAALAAQVALAGVGVALAGGSAAAGVAVPLAAAGVAVADGAAGAQATITIAAAGLAQAAGQAGLSASVLLQAAGAAQAAGNAALAAQLNALAAGAAQASGTANLSGGAPGELSAAGGAVAGGQAVLSVAIQLQAAGAAVAGGSASGLASAPGSVSASGGAVAAGTALPVVTVSLAAAGFVQAMGAGQLVVSVNLTALGQAVAGGSANLGQPGADMTVDPKFIIRAAARNYLIAGAARNYHITRRAS